MVVSLPGFLEHFFNAAVEDGDDFVGLSFVGDQCRIQSESADISDLTLSGNNTGPPGNHNNVSPEKPSERLAPSDWQ